MTYLEQVEPHIVDMEIINEIFEDSEPLHIYGCDYISYEPAKLSKPKCVEAICEQIVRSMKHLTKDDYLVAFSDIVPTIDRDDVLGIRYEFSWRAIA